MFRWFARIIPVLGFLAIACVASAWIYRFEIQYYRHQALIERASTRYRVPPALIGAVIWQETRFISNCRGKAGEMGLMQVMPQSGAEWAKAEKISGFAPEVLLDPGTNILAGTWYLSRALTRWETEPDPILPALAEYNAGRANALRWIRVMRDTSRPFTEAVDYPGTRGYIRAITRHYRSFGRPWERWHR